MKLFSPKVNRSHYAGICIGDAGVGMGRVGVVRYYIHVYTQISKIEVLTTLCTLWLTHTMITKCYKLLLIVTSIGAVTLHPQLL